MCVYRFGPRDALWRLGIFAYVFLNDESLLLRLNVQLYHWVIP